MSEERPPTMLEFIVTCIGAVIFLIIIFSIFPTASPAVIAFAIYFLYREYKLMKKGQRK